MPIDEKEFDKAARAVMSLPPAKRKLPQLTKRDLKRRFKLASEVGVCHFS